MLNEGDAIPDVKVELMEGGVVPIASVKPLPAVIYFYPKDDTPGCTNEAKDFSALVTDFSAAGVSIIGVSKDSPKRHQNFSAKHGLGFPLVTDADGSVCEGFGSWVEKSLYGRHYMGIDRSTFLIGKDGRVVRIWRKVKVKGHAAEVLAAAQSLA